MALKKTLPLWRALVAVFVSLLAAFASLYTVATTWRGTVDTALGTTSYETTADERFVSDYKTSDDLIAAHEELGERAGAEGAVLLKNEGKALPLTEETPRVTLFGMGSMYPFQGGVMGSTSEGKVNLVDALEEKGIAVNPTMVNVYTTLGNVQTGTKPGMWPGAPSTPVYGHRPSGFSNPYKPSEPSTDVYATDGGQADWASSYASDYNDAAIIVLSRPGSEGSDFYPGTAGVDTSTGATSALGLCDNERELIDLAGSAGFDRVIVLINSGSVMEIQEIKEDATVDAIMFVGYPGDYGFLGIADVIKGNKSPSGHLSDTFAVDNSKAPAALNFGSVGKVTDYSEIVVSDSVMGTVNPVTPESTFGGGVSMAATQYIIEAEGIYTGYKYYETRYYDALTDPTSNASLKTSDGRDVVSGADGWAYDAEVSYPFGYGLSYSSFEYSDFNVYADLDAKTVTATVTVKNVGGMPAREVVQLYVQAPYTDHDIQSGVEKSAVNFIGMHKTAELAVNATEEVTITVDMQYIASWDSTAKDGKGGYILDGGDYYFALGNGAHEAVNNIIEAQGTHASAVSGNASMVSVERIGTEGNVDENTFAQSKNGTDVVNQLQNADINYYRPDYATYLSRSDWQGTFPRTYNDLEVKRNGSNHFDEWITNLANETYKAKTDGQLSDTDLNGSGGTLTLAEVAGATDVESDYWDLLVGQIPAEKIYTIILKGGSATEMIDEISSPLVYQNDGPNGFSSSLLGRDNKNEGDKNADYMLNTMPNLVLLGCTFDKELLREWGELMGNDGLWTGNYLIWGAAGNIHRSAFNGRNFEYYSEDPMLSTYMLTETLLGALDYGVIVGPKHFAFNDQESYRGGIAPYMTEQKAREGDLRAFQGAMEGGALGVMTSFSRIGATAVHGSVPLLKNILRGEWGYKGLITTDMASNAGYFRAEAMINAGITMVADFTREEDFADVTANWSYFDRDFIEKDPNMLEMAKDNLKYQLYAFANSGVANAVTVRVTPWWEALLIALIVITAAGTAATVAMYVVATVKKGKED